MCLFICVCITTAWQSVLVYLHPRNVTDWQKKMTYEKTWVHVVDVLNRTRSSMAAVGRLKQVKDKNKVKYNNGIHSWSLNMLKIATESCQTLKLRCFGGKLCKAEQDCFLFLSSCCGWAFLKIENLMSKRIKFH